MANRNFKQHLAGASGYVALDGYMTVSDLVGTVGVQFVDLASVARTGVGQYTITLEDSYKHLKCCVATFCFPAGTPDYTYQVTSFGPTALGANSVVNSIVVQFKTSAAAAELPANCGVLWHIGVKKSSLGKGQ